MRRRGGGFGQESSVERKDMTPWGRGANTEIDNTYPDEKRRSKRKGLKKLLVLDLRI